MTVNAQLDKQAIASSFGRAASSYDAAASLQQRVGEALMACLPAMPPGQRADCSVLDLGCGTGYFSQRLRHRLNAPVIGVDLAEGMLSHARAHFAAEKELRWLCGDAENLPLMTGSVDYVFSSFALQWCGDVQRAFEESFRVLKNDGYLLLSMPVQGTLTELKQSWQCVDEARHVNEFLSEEEVAGALQKTFGHLPQQKNNESFSVQTEVCYYSQLGELLKELKCIGAHNVNRDRVKSLTTRRQYSTLLQSYEQFRTEQQLLPASYRLVYACFQKQL